MEQTQTTTKAQTFCEVVAAKLAALREAKGLVEYMLYDPSDEVIDAITSNGGRILRDGYEETCHSDTCAHNSHDAGYEYAYVEVPSSWLERPTDEVFDFNADGNEVGVMLIPADPPIAVFRHDCGCGFADWSGIAGLRPYVADAIGFLEDDDIDDADEIDCRDIPL